MMRQISYNDLSGADERNSFTKKQNKLVGVYVRKSAFHVPF